MYKESVQCDVCGRDVSKTGSYSFEARKDAPMSARGRRRFVRPGRRGARPSDLCGACYRKIVAAVAKVAPKAIIGSL
jgi:hypothetical protein